MAYDIQKADAKGTYIIKKIFQAYYSNPQQLPDYCVIDYLAMTSTKPYSELIQEKKVSGIGSLRKTFMIDMDKSKDTKDEQKLLYLMRIICNYIASMTDRNAQENYLELY